MSQKRINIEGGIYFVTSRTFNNKEIFTDENACKLFIEVLDYYHKKLEFHLHAYVIMPNNVHLLIQPTGRYGISEINHRIKGNFAIQYLQNQRNHQNHKGSDALGGKKKSSINTASEPLWFVGKKRHRIRINPVWQKSFYDRAIRTETQRENTMKYIDFNAVKHGLVDNPEKWLYSSYHNHHQTSKELIEIDYLT